ncbi:MAG: hypothetical protein F4Z63_12755 [Gammaproteobacteria bacterium]|nr:hypothetical protein [Gammaproteobacteria bacterium]MYJ21640.1 hypothetical protein [Rhodothermaceae bacterium]
MRGMNSATIDLIYLDPPFNSNSNYAAPIGSMAAGAEFKDTWTLSEIDIEWLDVIEEPYPELWRVLMAAMTDSDKSYLIYMAIRLLEMRRLLKPTGSIYLHCDPTMSHYLKLVMDAIFDRKSFQNEIIWRYGLGAFRVKSRYPRKHDIIFFYSRNPGNPEIFNVQRGEPTKAMLDKYCHEDSDGRYMISYGKKYYLKGGKPFDSVWNIPAIASTSKERTGYPTQKPIDLLQRIVEASSNKESMVFDPFCGCATTCVAAHNLGRNWVGIDISSKAADLVVDRISYVQGSLYEDIIHRRDVPQRTDLGKLPRYNCPENKEILYGKQRGYCASPDCRTHFEMRHLEVDHIVAKSKGGSDHISNLQLLCGSCNRIKGNRGMEYLRKQLRLAA